MLRQSQSHANSQNPNGYSANFIEIDPVDQHLWNYENVTNFALSTDLNLSFIEDPYFVEMIPTTLPGETFNSKRVHDKLLIRELVYKINLHQILQDVTSVNVVVDLWECDYTNNTFFLCCVVCYIDKDFTKHQYVLSFDQLERQNNTAEYLATKIKQITDAFGITFKVTNLIVDSATENVSFVDEFAKLVRTDINKFDHVSAENILSVFKDRRCLTRCPARIIHDSTLYFMKRLNNELQLSIDAIPEKIELSENKENDDMFFFGSSDDFPIEMNKAEVENLQFVCDLYCRKIFTTGAWEDIELTLQENSKTTLDRFATNSNEYDFSIAENFSLEKNLSEIEDIKQKLGELSVDETYIAPIGYKKCNAENIFNRLRNMISYQHHYKTEWFECCSEANLEQTMLTVPVPIRWSSLYLMISKAIEYKLPIIQFSAEKSKSRNLDDKYCAILHAGDFVFLEMFHNLMKPMFLLTEIASREDISISFWGTIISIIHITYSEYEKGLIEGKNVDDKLKYYSFDMDDFKRLAVCAKYALKTLQKYVEGFADSDHLMISQFFNPVCFQNIFEENHNGKLLGVDQKPLTKTLNQFKDQIIDEVVREVIREINLPLLGSTFLHSSNGTSSQYKELKDSEPHINMKKKMVAGMIHALSSQKTAKLDHGPEKFTSKGYKLGSRIRGTQTEKVLLKSVKFDTTDEEQEQLFKTSKEIEFECDEEWCLRKQIKMEWEKYESLVLSVEFSQDLFAEKYDGVYKSEAYALFNFDPLQFWKMQSQSFPLLSIAARRFLIGTPSSTFVEKVFSQASDFYIRKRELISPSMMSAVVFGNLNYRAKPECWISELRSRIDLEAFSSKYGNTEKYHPLADSNALLKKCHFYKSQTPQFKKEMQLPLYFEDAVKQRKMFQT